MPVDHSGAIEASVARYLDRAAAQQWSGRKARRAQ